MIEEIFYFIQLLISITVHEFSHSWAADSLGDPTPRLAGRLTLNPLPHIDFFLTILLPILLRISGSPVVFGAAKPVPFNPHFLKDKKWGPFLIALAGPFSNFILAIVFSFSLKMLVYFDGGFLNSSLMIIALFLEVGVIVNVILGMFNLIPIPPLDGSKILYVFLSSSGKIQLAELERVGFVLVVLFLLFAGETFWNAVEYVLNYLLPISF